LHFEVCLNNYQLFRHRPGYDSFLASQNSLIGATPYKIQNQFAGNPIAPSLILTLLLGENFVGEIADQFLTGR
jgi:hypothetical protein